MENNKSITIWQVLLEITTGGFTRDEPFEYYTQDLGFFMTENGALKKAKSYISEELKKELAYRDFYHIVCEPNWTPLKQLNTKDRVELNGKLIEVKYPNLWYRAFGSHKALYVKPVDLIDSLNTKDL